MRQAIIYATVAISLLALAINLALLIRTDLGNETSELVEMVRIVNKRVMRLEEQAQATDKAMVELGLAVVQAQRATGAALDSTAFLMTEAWTCRSNAIFYRSPQWARIVVTTGNATLTNTP